MKLELSLEQWQQVKDFAIRNLNLSSISKADCDLSEYIPYYNKWLENNYHADLEYMVKHGSKRFIPNELVPGTNSVIVATLNYLNRPVNVKTEVKRLRTTSNIADISIYAHGRDYHKVMKKKLQQLGEFIDELTGGHQFRVFTDSAPVLERPLAEKAGLGWQGKSSMLMNKAQGSFFFIGVIYSNLDLSKLPDSPKHQDSCGKCQACIKLCPTGAIQPGKMIDSRKCISYLTIENKGTIPLELRDKIGTRIYGCDDCQLVCPFNNYAPITTEKDFQQRDFLVNKPLLELLAWSEKDFDKYTQGSAIRRIGYAAWIRNIAIAVGNSPFNQDNIQALELKKLEFSDNQLVLEHLDWAINKQKLLS
ncbi:tRNA epoxyqueuosine(34) reductase QueG [Francisella tularensis subsp. novicida]|uniref:Epoxyqueuosine reductase n=2 Tax=Francisella tularensis TaxID=263 RepID=A0A6I4RWB6_FRATU|nr:tRNA epoxyqueuosine(34) reductase QueG [Francisella tularensis]ABK89664.1 4Fe-4S ferredoxin [Francisella tularensis subsp. novicida U112]AJI61637.1 epoxyqueuosine reductase [Francisella tularensis subsp. novicida U112]EDX27245.1 iron-sulfur cluster binding protein, putative [Francisella tularensis subsp. novicida FTE]MBK2034849.1 tRNA epoxyqueuosine(34) reductase QueG [Francisella tularensis subsp. novicida]MBK2116466.1 tRNA epoxyqueuosine(34) reductase QueG [Francisella tularensis subsp. n